MTSAAALGGGPLSRLPVTQRLLRNVGGLAASLSVYLVNAARGDSGNFRSRLTLVEKVVQLENPDLLVCAV